VTGDAAAATGRARSVAELRALGASFMTAEGRARGLALRTRPDDVIISTFPKCGTTWLQQIVHGLRTGGSMDFDEITEVVPWLELAHDMGVDPEAPQVAEPRVFKSHLAFDEVPRGARYVNAIRDPGDVLVSMYRFFEGWRFEPGSISLDGFALDYFVHRDYWSHVLSWWRARQRDDVLLLCYEDMLADHAGTVRRIASFIGVDGGEDLLATAVGQSTLAFMKAHERQFDDHLVREARDAACGLPAGGHSTKVASGTAGSARAGLSQAALAALDDAWRTRMIPHTGLADYRAMRRALAAGE
jgi:hypothetical protein